MKKNIIILLLVILVAAGVRYGMTAFSQFMKGKAAKNKPAPSVLVEPVSQTELIREYEAPGRVVSKYQVGVMARISGYLMKSYFKEGDQVKKGQDLFLIEPHEYQNNAAAAAASVKNIKAQLDFAEKQLVRSEELVAKDYIAKSQYDEVLANRNSLRAQLASAEAKLADSQRNLSYTVIKSPVDGRIGMINVTVGNYVTPSVGNLTTIKSNDPIYVTFPLTGEDLHSLHMSDKGNNTNRKVELIYSNGNKYEFTGVQDFRDNQVDQTTGTVTMRATFKNPNNELIHGEFFTVRLYANEPSIVPVVPKTAVMENQEGKYVYKLDEKGLPQLVYIKTFGEIDHDWIVKSGINIGDEIVTDGLQKVIPNSPITKVSKEEIERIKQFEAEDNNTKKKK